MPQKYVRAISKRTGKLIPRLVPESYLDLFGLRLAPKNGVVSETDTPPLDPNAAAPLGTEGDPEDPALQSPTTTKRRGANN